MDAVQAKRAVLVPIFGNDIGDDAYAVARTLLDSADSRLVLLHVEPGVAVAVDRDAPSPAADAESRWHRLAAALPPSATFVDAVAGDPVDEVLAEADRFHSEAIVLERPTSVDPADEWISCAIAGLVRAAPRRVRLADAARAERPAVSRRRVEPQTRRSRVR